MFEQSENQSVQYIINPEYDSYKVNHKYIGSSPIVYKIMNYNGHLSNPINFIGRRPDDFEKIEKEWVKEQKNLAQYRSVVISVTEPEISNIQHQPQLLCFSPPKSIDYDSFVQLYSDTNGILNDNEDMYINEIVEGTMINLFYDQRNHTWELATKSAIGAKYQYFQYNILENPNGPKTPLLTFRDMFMEALDLPHYTDINKVPFIKNLPKNHCYSFVLQHPQNHFVLPIEHPALYLVAVYKIENNPMPVAQYIPLKNVQEWDCLKDPKIKFPKVFDSLDLIYYDEIKNTYCSEFSNPHCLGFMFINQKTGHRMSMRNQCYEYIKKIRGNYSRIQYLYLNLLRTEKLAEFLEMFPFYKKIFYTHYELYKTYVASVHNAYMAVYVHKNNLTVLDFNIKYLIKKIHNEVFIPSLASNRIIITRRFVWRYLLDVVSPDKVMYCMVSVFPKESHNN
jgi:hypothetical protein